MMMPNHYFSYLDEYCEMLRYGNTVVIKDFKSGRYYQVTGMTVLLREIPWEDRHSTITSTRCYLFLLLFIGISGVTFAGVAIWDNMLPICELDSSLLIGCLIFAMAQICIHENAHWVALRHFGRKPDSIGLHLTLYVFPSIYVRMNDISLLTFQERIIVNAAGLVVNIISELVFLVVGCLMLKCDLFIRIAYLYNFSLLFNFLPIWHTDGYRVLLAINGFTEFKGWKHNPPLVKMISLLSIAIAVVYLFLAVCWLATMIPELPSNFRH